MPNYTFTNDKGESRDFMAKCTETVLIADGEKWKRDEVQSIQVAGAARGMDSREEVKRGYYREECVKGSRFKSRFPKSRIKRIWSF